MVREPKKNILVSFSGGETSAYMIKYLQDNYSDHNLVYVFANTGEENEETLEFVNRCQKYFNIDIQWIEYDLVNGKSSFRLVNYRCAYRSHNIFEIYNKWQNHPFRKMIEYYGLPNQAYPHCSRELKSVIIRKYMRSIGYKNGSYDIAIGIRVDEIDRIGEHFYPLAYANVTKQHINNFWNNMPFRLELKGYQGNCKVCWKKSDRKLCTIMRETPEDFGFFKQMQIEFSNYTPDRREAKNAPYFFFRKNRTVDDIKELSKTGIKNATDDSIIFNFQAGLFDELDLSNGCSESCEAFQ